MSEDASSEALKKAIVDMAVEAWRFRSTFEKAMSKLDAGESAKYLSKFSWFFKRVENALETAGMRLVILENERYSEGLPVTALNIDDFEADEPLYIDVMIEPIIMAADHIVKSGSVMLRRYEE